MAVSGAAISNITDPTTLFVEIGRVGNWIQAVGLLVIFWIVTQSITMFFNRRRRKLLEDIDKRVYSIEKKIARLEKLIQENFNR